MSDYHENDGHKKGKTSSSKKREPDLKRKHNHSDDDKVHKKSKKHKLKKQKVYDHSSSSSEESNSSLKQKKHKSKKKKKKKDHKHKDSDHEKKKEHKEKKVKLKATKPSETVPAASLAMRPMTQAEWEAQQSVVRRVVDKETGRSRLVKGDGEILEEIVSRKQHLAINKKATLGDGLAFQEKLGLT